MRRASARRTRSPAAGPSAARVQAHPKTSEPHRLISSARSAPRMAKAQPHPAQMRHRSDEPASGRNRHSDRAGRARRAPRRSGRLAFVGPAHRAANITLIALPAKCPELNPQEKSGYVPTTFTVRFGLEKMGVAPAGVDKPNSGHHHLLIDAELPPLDKPIPNDENHPHFGAGQTEATVTLPRGRHTLQLLLGVVYVRMSPPKPRVRHHRRSYFHGRA